MESSENSSMPLQLQSTIAGFPFNSSFSSFVVVNGLFAIPSQSFTCDANHSKFYTAVFKVQGINGSQSGKAHFHQVTFSQVCVISYKSLDLVFWVCFFYLPSTFSPVIYYVLRVLFVQFLYLVPTEMWSERSEVFLILNMQLKVCIDLNLSGMCI